MVPILTYAFATLPKLEVHLPTILASAAFFFALEYVSGRVSPKISSSYRNHPKKTQIAWNSNVAAFVHAVIICPLVWKVSTDPALVKDQLWGYSWEAGQVFAVACGFIWDTVFSLFNCPLDFILHGVGGMALMTCSFHPFVGYYVSRFLLWELSTPFLNAHWFFEKTGRGGSAPMVINAASLLVVFFLSRILYGSVMSFNFLSQVWKNASSIPLFLKIVFVGFDIAMSGLNFLWFFKMVKAMGRRLRGEKKPVVGGKRDAMKTGLSAPVSKGEKQE